MKGNIWHVMWEFKNNKNTSEADKKICCVYGQGVIFNVKSNGLTKMNLQSQHQQWSFMEEK